LTFTADIKSKHSAANIILEENISNHIDELYRKHSIKVKNYNLPDGETRVAYIVDDTITIATLSDGTIFSIGCNVHYPGLYRGVLSTGMSFGQIKKLTKRQRIFNGSVIIDDDFGFSYVLPAPYDEIADSIEDIPLDLILNEIYISDFFLLAIARVKVMAPMVPQNTLRATSNTWLQKAALETHLISSGTTMEGMVSIFYDVPN